MLPCGKAVYLIIPAAHRLLNHLFFLCSPASHTSPVLLPCHPLSVSSHQKIQLSSNCLTGLLCILSPLIRFLNPSLGEPSWAEPGKHDIFSLLIVINHSILVRPKLNTMKPHSHIVHTQHLRIYNKYMRNLGTNIQRTSKTGKQPHSTCVTNIYRATDIYILKNTAVVCLCCKNWTLATDCTHSQTHLRACRKDNTSLQIAWGMLYCSTRGSQGTPEFHYLTLPRHPFIRPAFVIRLRFVSLRCEFVYYVCRYWDSNMFFCHGVDFIMTE